jgi:hypothetical protein
MGPNLFVSSVWLCARLSFSVSIVSLLLLSRSLSASVSLSVFLFASSPFLHVSITLLSLF